MDKRTPHELIDLLEEHTKNVSTDSAEKILLLLTRNEVVFNLVWGETWYNTACIDYDRFIVDDVETREPNKFSREFKQVSAELLFNMGRNYPLEK